MCSIITFNIEIKQDEKLKLIKKINFVAAVTNIRNYLKNIIDSMEITEVIKKSGPDKTRKIVQATYESTISKIIKLPHCINTNNL